jgi:hypothetical protein
MVKLASLLVLVAFVTTACVATPESLPVPPQHTPALWKDAPALSLGLLQMSDPQTDAYIVQDLPKGETGPWRWTGLRPTVRFYLTSVENYRARIEYTIAEVTFKTTGPVTLRILINGHLLEAKPHRQHGTFVFDKPVPPAMLKTSADNELAIEVDKPFVAEHDGAKLGFILSAIGIVR